MLRWSPPSEEVVAVDAVVDVHGIDLAENHAIGVAVDSAIEVAIHPEIHLDLGCHPNFEIDVDLKKKEEEEEEEEQEEIGRQRRHPELEVAEGRASCANFLSQCRRRFRWGSRRDTFSIRIFPSASR